MNLPTLNKLNCTGKNIIIRADLDAPIDGLQVIEDTRLQVLLPTIKYLLKNGCQKLLLIGHRDRPEGTYQEFLSLKPLIDYFSSKLSQKIGFIEFTPYLENLDSALKTFHASSLQIHLLENLRFWTGEEANDQTFAARLSEFGDAYVNEAFATSHRTSASLVALPHFFKTNLAFGLYFVQEVSALNKIFKNPSRPVIILLSGFKKDKLDYLNGFLKFSDKILVAGRLPEYLDQSSQDPKVLAARLLPDKEDITVNSIELFEKEIKTARTIILAGPTGHFEDESHRLGTQRIFQAVANSPAYKIAGGGDTIHALNLLGLKDKFDWISIGGGAMLEYLSTGSLPALKALV